MRILTTLFPTAARSQMRAALTRRWAIESPAAMYEVLWAYYFNNDLYDALRSAGHFLDNRTLRELHNPAFRVAEFYAATLWPGPLARALPLVVEGQPEVEGAIDLLYKWSNWAAKKQVLARWAAVTGNAYIRVARPLPLEGETEAPQRVYLQLVEPQYVTEQEVDERGYLTYCRLDIPQEYTIREGGQSKTETRYHTEIWDRQLWRVWYTKEGSQLDTARLPATPEHEVKLSSWGIDFVPIVHAKFIDVGADEGLGAYTVTLSKINALNEAATRLHQMLYRHNDVTWALKSNMTDTTGRPIPPPRLAGANAGETGTIELGGEKMVRLPGMAELQPLVPQLDYGSHLAALESLQMELKDDLPELAYWQLRDLPEMSGRALRLVLTAAIARAAEARGNLEDALIRAQTMALTIGANIGAWEKHELKVGTYEAGDFEHAFAERPILPLTRHEIAALTGEEVTAGIPLVTSLRRSGWTEAELDEMAEDMDSANKAQTQTLASAMLNAQDAFGAGAQSNGLERPEPAAGPDSDLAI